MQLRMKQDGFEHSDRQVGGSVDSETTLPKRSREYLGDMVREKFKRLKGIWNAAQPKIGVAGTLETPQEIEDCLNAEKAHELKTARQNTRRMSVSYALNT